MRFFVASLVRRCAVARSATACSAASSSSPALATSGVKLYARRRRAASNATLACVPAVERQDRQQVEGVDEHEHHDEVRQRRQRPVREVALVREEREHEAEHDPRHRPEQRHDRLLHRARRRLPPARSSADERQEEHAQVGEPEQPHADQVATLVEQQHADESREFGQRRAA